MYTKRQHMFSRHALFISLVVCIAACSADNISAKSQPTINNGPFLRYVPEGWILQNQRILDIDIDGDGTNDAILTMIEDEQLQKGDILADDDERALLVLLGDKKGGYRRSSFAKNVILCASCAGMMGKFGSKEQGVILYENEKNIFTIGWTSGSRETVNVGLHFGFDAKSKQFILLSDRVEKADRVEGKSTTTYRDFVTGAQTVDGKVSRIEKKVIPIESVKYYDYLGRN